MRLQTKCPALDVQAQCGQFNLAERIAGSWSVIMFHPAAFTPVCSSEIVKLAMLMDDRRSDWQGLSVVPDPVETARDWMVQVSADSGVPVDHPCIADPDFALTLAFGFDADGLTREGPRGCFIFDPDARLSAFAVLPREVGFSSTELVRVINALQRTRAGAGLTPADWEPGDPLISGTGTRNQ